MSEKIKSIQYVLFLTILVLLIDDIFLGVDIHTRVAFHSWSSPLYITISYLLIMLAVEGISLCLLASNRILSISLFILYIVSWLLEVNYKLIGGAGFNFNELLNICHNPEFILEAIKSFISIKSIIFSIMVILFWFMIYLLINRKIIKKKISLKRTFILLAILILIDIFVYKKVHKFTHYPSNLKVLHSTALQLFFTEPLREREVPKNLIIKKEDQISSNIILIVDESIRGDILQLNGYPRENTPYLNSIKDELINFGIAVSATTQSHESNLIIRMGVPLETLPDHNRVNEKNMPLAYYAKRANFSTTILDSQSVGILNGLRDSDRKYIDNIITYKEINASKPYRDRKMIDEMVRIIDKNKKNYIFFNKYGAHFHYDDTYPEDKKRFSPTIRMEEEGVSEKEKRVNSYCNSIVWSVDAFWKDLIHKLSDKDVIVIYVSDHGQSLMEDPNYKRTHAGKKVEQSMVPLWIYASPKAKERLFEKYGKDFLENKNRLSHFEIFPTVLKLFGIETDRRSMFDHVDANRSRYYFSPEGGVGRLILLQKHEFIFPKKKQ